uniref:Alpha N-terminal protein methyltransferase 1 n=1 Tax=Solanum tuberosum TaxID=4113 RepID=M1ALD8_SOLTU
METGGLDSDGRTFKNAEEMWREEVGDGDPQKKFQWYNKGINYWQGVEATVDGVLGGYGHVNTPDIKASEDFLNTILAERFPDAGRGRHLVALEENFGYPSLVIFEGEIESYDQAQKGQKNKGVMGAFWLFVITQRNTCKGSIVSAEETISIEQSIEEEDFSKSLAVIYTEEDPAPLQIVNSAFGGKGIRLGAIRHD